jgi:cytochrome b561
MRLGAKKTERTTMPRTDRYNGLAIALHWILATLILFQIPLGIAMKGMPRGAAQLDAINLHKSLGATILAIAAIRLLWRLFNRAPPLPADLPGWRKGIAHASHWLMYLCFFGAPLTGWAMSSAEGYPVSVFGLLKLPDLVPADKALGETFEGLHMVFTLGLAMLVLIHIGAALQHFLIRRDGILARMLPFARWPAR